MKKVKNPLPVSTKYYERLQSRVKYIFRAIGCADDAKDFAYTLVMGHSREDAPSVYSLDDTLSIIYITLRHEIRTAIQRSQQARARARRRAERAKESILEVEKAECPAMGHSADKTTTVNPTLPVDGAPDRGDDYSSPCDFSAYSLRSLSCTSAGTSS